MLKAIGQKNAYFLVISPLISLFLAATPPHLCFRSDKVLMSFAPEIFGVFRRHSILIAGQIVSAQRDWTKKCILSRDLTSYLSVFDLHSSPPRLLTRQHIDDLCPCIFCGAQVTQYSDSLPHCECSKRLVKHISLFLAATPPHLCFSSDNILMTFSPVFFVVHRNIVFR